MTSEEKSNFNLDQLSIDDVLEEITTQVKRNRPRPHPRVIENFQLIWLDSTLADVQSEEYRTTIESLREFVNSIDTFDDVDQCFDFLTKVKDENVFLIISGSLGQQVIPSIHNLVQLHSIYVFCANRIRHAEWAKSWPKIRGVFNQIMPICCALKQSIDDFEKNSISVSFVSANQMNYSNLDQLDQSFMYTQVLKEILFEIQYDDQAIRTLISYCQEKYAGNANEMQIIDSFEQNYRRKSPSWWYTYPCFIHSMLNRALRTFEVDMIIRMGFFIQDLHRQIEKLHREQSNDAQSRLFTVYRGQSLTKDEFEKFIRAKGGLMSFNNFLSTSKKRNISLEFARDALNNLEMFGVLFKMTIDPANLSTPYAMINDVSYFSDEHEILFSMHTIFRIGEIKSIENHQRLFQVDLKLTSIKNQQIIMLIDRLREETTGSTGWHRLGMLLIKLGRFDKAEQVYTALFDSSPNDKDKTLLYHQLGLIKRNQADYFEALELYRKAIEIHKESSEQNQLSLATIYNNMGQVYNNLGEFGKALAFFEKSLEIYQTTCPTDHLSLAISYNNIGLTHRQMDNSTQAFVSHKKAVEIEEKILPANHPSLATSYKNLALVYKSIGNYSKALDWLEKALQIEQIALPRNHPSLAISYNNIGLLYATMGEYLKALSFYDKTLEIYQKILPSTHPDLATSYNNIGSVYMNIGDYSKALWFYEKTREIEETVLPSDHPSLAITYSNIGMVYSNLTEYSTAFSYHRKALEIRQRIFPENHPMIATSYSNIGSVNHAMRNYNEALQFYEKTLTIEEKILPAHHRDLATSYNNIGIVYDNIGEYEKALSFHQKALNIFEKTLSSSHPDLAISYYNLGLVYQKLTEYRKAISFYEKALEIQQKILPANHLDLTKSYENLSILYELIGEKNRADFCHDQSVTKSDCSNSTEIYKTIDLIYDNRNDSAKSSISNRPTIKSIRTKTLRQRFTTKLKRKSFA